MWWWCWLDISENSTLSIERQTSLAVLRNQFATLRHFEILESQDFKFGLSFGYCEPKELSQWEIELILWLISSSLSLPPIFLWLVRLEASCQEDRIYLRICFASFTLTLSVRQVFAFWRRSHVAGPCENEYLIISHSFLSTTTTMMASV